ncbi:hypothetical protein N5C72_24605 [Achromobacter mucicolens]|uniref:Uncharacterized protein n=1 Tax=Achromobacter mucicolens TaxID=1389922 RepID=A0ABD4Z2F2_9BURK|nr:hypothetical protein [Achromobacter mucicolens]MDG9971596.1 hypothetical protein [Achromobacter mucicolens]MDH1181269.1 hypothetical protein [Achromobacter mucicolens]
MAYNDSTTIGEIMSLAAKVREENDVFETGKRKLAVIFLRRLLDLGPNATVEDLEASYKVCSPHEDIPDNSEEFWTYVEKEYLRLDSEPKEKFAEIALRINEDLEALAKNISEITKELAILEEKNSKGGRLKPEERYYKHQLVYFKNKNLAAKDEIVDFMTRKIRGYAVSAASVKYPALAVVDSIFGNSPYAFGRRFGWAWADPYDFRSLDIFSNKFLDLPLSSHREVVNECKASPAKFKEYAVAYIGGIPGEVDSLRVKLNDLVGKSHILFERKSIIETMLRHYEAKDYLSLVSMAPLQIEGIFADICREIGVSEEQLDSSSLNDKLQHIDTRMRSFFFFEYYSFKFPVLRNLIAHGGLVDGDLEEMAHRLMLDLLPVCELAVSEDLPLFRALEVLSGASNGKPDKLVEWLDLRSVTIPKFYNAHDAILKADAHYASQPFWDYLERRLKLLDMVGLDVAEEVKIAGRIKREGLAGAQAQKFLKSTVPTYAKSLSQRGGQSANDG